MNSMTGFGRAEVSGPLGRLTIDISSVNNRFLDFSFRAPRHFYPLEIRVRELVGEQIVRGKVNVSIAFEESENSSTAFRLNLPAARSYYKQLVKLKKELGIVEDVQLMDVLVFPEISAAERIENDYESYWPMFEKGIKRALKQLVAMRRKEGQSMAADMRTILKQMAVQVKGIQTQTATSVEYYRNKLTERIKEILDTPLRDSLRLEEEIAVFAEKSDVTEEYTRLNSHIGQFRSALKSNQQVGKKLNFLLQEMNREVNTIGSKCADFSITSTVIQLKEAIEQLREMVQNAE